MTDWQSVGSVWSICRTDIKPVDSVQGGGPGSSRPITYSACKEETAPAMRHGLTHWRHKRRVRLRCWVRQRGISTCWDIFLTLLSSKETATRHGLNILKSEKKESQTYSLRESTHAKTMEIWIARKRECGQCFRIFSVSNERRFELPGTENVANVSGYSQSAMREGMNC